MEFLPNGTLFKVIEKGPLPLPVTKTIFRQLATTLDYIHQKGIAHGDIKPENILISEDYKIKICDFGFARVVSNNPQEAVGGSKGYTAPEIYKPLVEDLRKCDIFSLGVVLFIMMTGVMPFLNNIPEILDPWWSMLQK
jgi:serine/threonine protein kinase